MVGGKHSHRGPCCAARKARADCYRAVESLPVRLVGHRLAHAAIVAGAGDSVRRQKAVAPPVRLCRQPSDTVEALVFHAVDEGGDRECCHFLSGVRLDQPLQRRYVFVLRI